jgi:serine/threonine protein kinase
MPAAFTAPAPSCLAPLFPGHDIECLIATGGMGAVYRAVQKSLDRSVAIKILPREFSTDAAFRTGFETEAKAMARLNHPNLIGVYDFGEVDGMLYISMEYVPGNSLFHSAHGVAIDPAEVIRLVTGICSGLSHAHENGIIHRDIKPSNILLDLKANPKIGDFGIARPVERKPMAGEEIFGTPQYTAPEVVTAPEAIDHRADIFSVGVILHELLTGRLPAEDPRPASVVSHCDPRFDAIIRRATDPVPGCRYAGAMEIAHDLQHIARSPGPRIHRPDPSGPPVTAPPRRHKTSSGFAWIVILLLAATLAAIVLWRISDEKNRSLATTPMPPPTATAVTDEGVPPAGKPPLDHQPAPAAIPETSPAEPVPALMEPAPAAGSAPAFDVPGFLENRARKIMRDRAAPLIQTLKPALARNFASFQRDLERGVRKIIPPPRREMAGEALQDFINSCKEDDGRIPGELSRKLENLTDAADIHAEFLAKQTAIEDTFHREIAKLSETYILGIQKQIERLKSDHDQAAIRLLEDEIQQVRENDSYFRDLMLTP